MKKIIITSLAIVALLGIAPLLYAATQKQKPVLSAVTATVYGLHCKACQVELQKDLGEIPGVSEVVVKMSPGRVTAKLDQSKLTPSEFVAAISAHRQLMNKSKIYTCKLIAFIDAKMCEKNPTMCPGCFTEIPKVLKTIKGVKEVSLDETGKIASITFIKKAKVTTKAIADALRKSEYKFTVRFDRPLAPVKNSAPDTCCPAS